MTEPERDALAAQRRDGPDPADAYDAELRAHNTRLRAATGVHAGDRVLDIGCGTGQTTREAARIAAPGAVLGIDLSAAMLRRARALTASAHLDNVTYRHGDAQVYAFPNAHYDLAISRFGTMFFPDPLAAFTNIARALRTDARLVMLVWQSRERNEWASALYAALGTSAQESRPPATLDPFTLADKSATSAILGRSGFHDITFGDVHEPMVFGPDSASAFEHVHAFQNVQNALASMRPPDAAQARARLRHTLQTHHTSGAGVVFDSRAWLITAHRTDSGRPTGTRPATTKRNAP
ncbi:Methyltransferase domain-containing protein [Nonomuraea solani]|uniref:Methyltransferase domain-containing protein n=1 Tax=Nonomuraea solani TaxID=1144553 RepID=A0A1H6EGR5_9ACTN|nr:class I SAM-dependent methyltransferase [Nonomuraea solani]SEG96139.1 Methyltransferase domain-containing protein [Nonomuraea solani]